MTDKRKVIPISEGRPSEPGGPYTLSAFEETQWGLLTKGIPALIEAAVGEAIDENRGFLIEIKGPDRVRQEGTRELLGYQAHMSVTLFEKFDPDNE